MRKTWDGSQSAIWDRLGRKQHVVWKDHLVQIGTGVALVLVLTVFDCQNVTGGTQSPLLRLQNKGNHGG